MRLQGAVPPRPAHFPKDWFRKLRGACEVPLSIATVGLPRALLSPRSSFGATGPLLLLSTFVPPSPRPRMELPKHVHMPKARAAGAARAFLPGSQAARAQQRMQTAAAAAAGGRRAARRRPLITLHCARQGSRGPRRGGVERKRGARQGAAGLLALPRRVAPPPTCRPGNLYYDTPSAT